MLVTLARRVGTVEASYTSRTWWSNAAVIVALRGVPNTNPNAPAVRLTDPTKVLNPFTMTVGAVTRGVLAGVEVSYTDAVRA